MPPPVQHNDFTLVSPLKRLRSNRRPIRQPEAWGCSIRPELPLSFGEDQKDSILNEEEAAVALLEMGGGGDPSKVRKFEADSNRQIDATRPLRSFALGQAERSLAKQLDSDRVKSSNSAESDGTQLGYAMKVPAHNVSAPPAHASADRQAPAGVAEAPRRRETNIVLAPLRPAKGSKPERMHASIGGRPDAAECQEHASTEGEREQARDPALVQWQARMSRQASADIRQALAHASAAMTEKHPPQPTPQVILELADARKKQVTPPKVSRPAFLSAKPQDQALQQPHVVSSRGGRLLVFQPPATSALATDVPPLTAARSVSGQLSIICSSAAVHQQTAKAADVHAMARSPSATTNVDQKASWLGSSNSTAIATNLGSSSGDESSEDNWQPNWGLNLFSVLNPTVITTGHSSFNEMQKAET